MTPAKIEQNGTPAATKISIIIPARNEEACLAACLESLVSQEGVAFEIIVVDDESTDRTPAIAGEFSGVRVFAAAPLRPGWTGKSNAAWTGVQQATGEWFLFTDADTIHEPNSLARSLATAEELSADMLSYSPEQITVSPGEQLVIPVVFAELVGRFSMDEINDPKSSVVAANGQYILIRRSAYEMVGGHASVAGEILEDLELARRIKQSGHKLVFRYGAGLVRTRMYRNFGHLVEGWTKNLALLFPGWKSLLLLRAIEWCVCIAAFGLSFSATWPARAWFTLIAVALFLNVVRRIRRSNFSWGASAIAFFGVPLFLTLLAQSHIERSMLKRVIWKDRVYSVKDDAKVEPASGKAMQIQNHGAGKQ